MISIVIPTYNESGCIAQTLQDLTLLCNEAEVEIIVSDGGSTDGTVEIASGYARVVQGQKGKALQLNAGARSAAGDILFFVHADMAIPRGALRLIHEKINVEASITKSSFMAKPVLPIRLSTNNCNPFNSPIEARTAIKPPEKHSRADSIRICFLTSQEVAPTASRTANSFLRSFARLNSNVVRFRPASKRTITPIPLNKTFI